MFLAMPGAGCAHPVSLAIRDADAPTDAAIRPDRTRGAMRARNVGRPAPRRTDQHSMEE